MTFSWLKQYLFTAKVIGELFLCFLLQQNSKGLSISASPISQAFAHTIHQKMLLLRSQMTCKRSQVQCSPLSPHLVWSKAIIWHTTTFLLCPLSSLAPEHNSFVLFCFSYNIFLVSAAFPNSLPLNYAVHQGLIPAAIFPTIITP